MKRICRFVLAALILLALVMPGSAEISAIRFGGNYQIKITGPIEEGDYQTLVDAIYKESELPDGVQIDAESGDITESMRIGRFVRRGMLAATTGKACAGGCFLIWAGAVQRKAVGPIKFGLNLKDSDELNLVREYLREMEVSDDLAEKFISANLLRVVGLR